MTIHVSPELTGTELTGAYNRELDGAITVMRQIKGNPGWFKADVESTREMSEEDTAPVMGGDTKALNNGKEVSEHIGFIGLLSIAEKQFDMYPDEDKDPEDKDDDHADDGAVFNANGTRYRRSKPHPSFIDGKYRRSDRQAYYPRPPTVVSQPYTTGRPINLWRLVDEAAITRAALPAVLAVNDGESLRKVRIDAAGTCSDCTPLADMVDVHARYGEKLIWRDAVDRWSVADLAEPVSYRDIGACYDAEYPQKDYSDSKIFPRKPRNSSSKKEAWRLTMWSEYRRLNGSLEPLQTIYGKADSEKYVEGVDYDEDGGGAAKDDVAVPHADAELENRPSVEEMVARYDVPGVQYETRVVRCRAGGPTFQGFNPCPDESFTREMKIPVSGVVECIGYPKSVISDHDEDAARKSMLNYETCLKEHKAKFKHSYWTEKKRKTQKQIGIVANRQATAATERGPSEEREAERLNIADVDRSKPWSICRIGGLRFAPHGTKRHYRGQLTHYANSKNPNRWHRAKEDVAGTPYGPASLEKSDPKYWTPLHPLTRETRMVELSGAEKTEQWGSDKPDFDKYRKLYHGSVEHVPCHTLYHKRVGDRSRISYLDGLRPRETTWGVFDRDYAFGRKYSPPAFATDDVVERRSYLEAVNSMLTPQGRIVANAIVWTELTTDLPKSEEEMGVLLCKGVKLPSKSKLRRDGKKAISDTEEELLLIYQALAA